jgi:methionyl-tRNA formyltransferase
MKNRKVKNIIFIGESVLLKYCISLFKKKSQKIKYKKIFLISKININGIKKISLKDLEKFDKIDFLFSIINPQIIKKKILEKCKLGLNLHNGLLPKYRGLNSSSFAILNDEKFHGATWHKLDTGIDTGKIAFQEKFKIDKKHDSQYLDYLSEYYGLKLFSNNIDKIIENKINYKLNNYKKYIYLNDKYFIKNFKSGYIKKSYSVNKILKFFSALSVSKNKQKFLFTPKILIKNKNFKVLKIIISKTRLKQYFLFKKLKKKFIYFKIQLMK